MIGHGDGGPGTVRLPGPAAGWALVAGVVLGIAYTLSPLTVWCVAALVPLCAWSLDGLPEIERRWVLTLLCVAVAVRILLVGALFVAADSSTASFATLFHDEAYLETRALRLRNVWLEIPMSPYALYNAYESLAWTSYIGLLAYIQYLIGPAPYAARFCSLLLFVAAAMLLYRMVRRAWGAAAALVGLGLVLFLPTLLVWSVSLLKEALHFFLGTVSIVSGVALVRATGWRRLAALMALIGAAVVLETVRAGGSSMVVIALLAGYTVWLLTRSRARFVAALVVVPLVAAAVLSRPAVQQRLTDGIRELARQHRGHAQTPGHNYKLLDERFYTLVDSYLETMTGAERLRYVTRATLSFVTVPLPWQIRTRSELAIVPEQLLYYLLVAIAPVGVLAAWRRDALVTCLMAAYTVVAAASVAFTSGNVGTLVRHRAVALPFVIAFAALGLVVVLTRLGTARERTVRTRAPGGGFAPGCLETPR